MLNYIVLMGRLTKSVELRYTMSEKPVASFTLAVDRVGKDKQTDFIDCVAWNGTAEFVNRHFVKGSKIIVEGRLQIRDWTDKDGNKRKSAEVVAKNVYFAESKKDAQKSFKEQFEEIGEDGEVLPF